MPREGLSEIHVVLDRSGSMSSVRNDTIGGFNTFLKEQKDAEGKAFITLAQFDHEYEIVHDAVDIQDAPDLDVNTYVPRGSTALLDAVGRKVSSAKARIEGMKDEEKPEKVIFVIMTDGEENASKEFTREKVFELIKECEDKYDWDFIYLGANQDAIQEGARFGMRAANTMSYAASGIGTSDALRSMSANVSDYRGSGIKSALAFKDDQREQQDKMINGIEDEDKEG